MKKKFSSALFLSLLTGLLLLSGCGSTEADANTDTNTNNNQDINVDDLYQAYDERQIVVKDLPQLEIGDLINLDDYIEIIPGDNESASEKLDLSYEVELMTSTSGIVLERISNTLTSSNSFRAIRQGFGAILITSHNVSKEVYVYVEMASEITSIVEYFSDWTFSNYTVESSYEIDVEFNTVTTDPTPYFYRTENYFFNQNDSYGYFLYGDVAYQYRLESKDDESSFYPYFYENNTNRVTSTVYNNSFRTFNNIFTTTNISYNEEVAALYGEEYGYGISSSTTAFTYLLNNLGLGSTVTLFNYTLDVTFIVPVVNGDDVTFYAYAYHYLRGHVLLGDITITDINQTSVSVLEDVVNDESFGYVTIGSTYLNSFSEITSYTSKVTGKYITGDGEPYTPTDTYLTYLPNDVDLTVEVTSTSLKFSNFTYIEKGVTGEVTLSYDQTDELYHKITSTGDEGVYYYNDECFADYKDVDDFSYYDFSSFFTSANFDNVLFYQGEDGTFRGSSVLNDALEELLKSFIPLTSAKSLYNTSGPLAYYLGYSYVDINIPSDASSISGEVLTMMADNNEIFYYQYTFNLYDFGTL